MAETHANSHTMDSHSHQCGPQIRDFAFNDSTLLLLIHCQLRWLPRRYRLGE